MDKYEYLTGGDLGYKPGVVEKVKFEHLHLDEDLNNKSESKTGQIDKRNKIDKTGKRNKNLIYNPQYSFAKFRDINNLKKMSLDSMY